MGVKSQIKQIQETVEEILTEEEFENLINSDQLLKHYIGFEISGKVHLGTGLMCMRPIKAFQEAGIATSCFLANWHSYINKKLGGNFQLITSVASEYFKEALVASALCVGADPDKIRFILASDIYNEDYWLTVLEVASNMTLSRGKRSLDIAGRQAADGVALSLLFYPPMQVADIFHQAIHFAHAGTDQRKAHVVARQVALKLTHSPLIDECGNQIKPVGLHHHLIQGLAKPPIWPIPKDKKRDVLISMKMSKSKPETAVFIHDDPDLIEYKIKKAFCPPQETEYNPIIDWTVNLILPIKGRLRLERPEKFGGDKTITSKDELIKSYQNGEIHPDDLKKSVIKCLVDMLQPAYKHFEHPDRKKALQRLEEIRITR